MVERLPSSPLKIACAPNLTVLNIPMGNTRWRVLATPGSKPLCTYSFRSFPSLTWSNTEGVMINTLIEFRRRDDEWPEELGLGKIVSTRFSVPGFGKTRAILEGVEFFNFGESGLSWRAAPLSSMLKFKGRTLSSYSPLPSRPASYKNSVLVECLAEPHRTTRGQKLERLHHRVPGSMVG